MAPKPNKRNGVKKSSLKVKRRSSGRKAFPAIQQGTGQTARKAFGNSKGLRGALTAYCPAHLPLPVATGGYTTVRVTQLISSNDAVFAFGTFKGSLEFDGSATGDSSQSGWAPYCAVSSGSVGENVTPLAGARFYRMNGMENLGPMATVVPSALSVQLMNPQALQTTNGILYVGRMTTQLRGEDEISTWGELANQFVSYQAPRLCSAGKLALRGVTVDAAPFNLTELMDFERLQDPSPGSGPSVDAFWSSTSQGTDPQITRRWHMKGFSPIMVYNPANVGVNFLVTMELRVRFDIGHPASSTHTIHAPVSHQTWGKAISDMVSAGHGVMDIAERVANMGSAFNGALEFGSRAQLALGM